MRGCFAYSAITSRVEADMALAFEYYMNTTYEFSSSFQEQLAESGSSLRWHPENLGRVKGRICAGNGGNALGD